jgi:hypothetical protein
VRAGCSVVEESPAGARRLSDAYWSQVERMALGLLHVCDEGGALVLRGPRPLPPLMRLGPLRTSAEPGRVEAAHDIRGGFLVRRAGGRIAFTQLAEGGIELRVTVDGFQPALAGRPGLPRLADALYARLQLPVHVAVSRRYFASLLDGAA